MIGTCAANSTIQVHRNTGARRLSTAATAKNGSVGTKYRAAGEKPAHHVSYADIGTTSAAMGSRSQQVFARASGHQANSGR